MNSTLLVALGGAIGSAARYQLSGWVLHQTTNWRFPLGTFLVNVTGCMVIGVLAGLAVREDLLTAEMRLFLFTGILGGFTTFSAFGLETFYLLKRGELAIALAYVLASVVCGLLAVWVGFSTIPQQIPR